MVSVERAGVVINRGWIPYHMKDKRKRHWEQNNRHLVKVRGVWRRGKDVHDYKVPNNPDSNEWHNICCEDILGFWELPNQVDMKFFYFQQVDIEGDGGNELQQEGVDAPYPIPITRDELINDQYHWVFSDKFWNRSWKLMTGISLWSAGWAFYWL